MGSSGKTATADSALKAILGVKSEAPKQPAVDATLGLKSMLGIAFSLPKAQTKAETELKTDPTSAADALMQLMVQSPSHTQQAPGYQQQSQFNFTYVKEGDAPAPP